MNRDQCQAPDMSYHGSSRPMQRGPVGMIPFTPIPPPSPLLLRGPPPLRGPYVQPPPGYHLVQMTRPNAYDGMMDSMTTSDQQFGQQPEQRSPTSRQFDRQLSDCPEEAHAQSGNIQLSASHGNVRNDHSDSREDSSGESRSVSGQTSGNQAALELQMKMYEEFRAMNIVVPRFYGSPASFWPWLLQIEGSGLLGLRDQSMVFGKLLGAVKGAPKTFIESCVYLPPTEGVQRALALLKERYGHSEIITDDILGKLVKGPDLLEESSEMTEFIANTGTACEALANLDLIEQDRSGRVDFYSRLADSPQYLGRIVSRLPRTWQKAYFSKSARDQRLVTLQSFLDDKGKAAASPVAKMVRELSKLKLKSKKTRDYMDSADHSSGSSGFSDNSAPRNVFTTQVSEDVCIFCAKRHELAKCRVFLSLNPEARYCFVRSHGLCFCCLRFCRKNSRSTCGESRARCSALGADCQWSSDRAHHALLCAFRPPAPIARNVNSTLETNDSEAEVDVRENRCETSEDEDSCYHSIRLGEKSNQVFMNVIALEVKNPDTGKGLTTLGMLDPCANVDVGSRELVTKLGVPIVNMSATSISTVSGSNLYTLRAHVQVTGIHEDSPTVDIDDLCVLDCKHFAKLRVPGPVDVVKWPELRILGNTRPLDIPRVSVLISMKRPGLHKPVGPVIETVNGPVITPTVLGYVVSGVADLGPRKDEGKVCNFVANIVESDEGSRAGEELPWTVEDAQSLYASETAPSVTERMALQRMEDSVEVREDKIQVSVPWKKDAFPLPDNRGQAVKVLESSRKNFRANPGYFQQYDAQIQTHLEKGHAEVVPPREVAPKSGRQFYLIHHSVKHPRKDKLRVVMNGKKMYQGRSINSAVIMPPNLLNKLTAPQLVLREQDIAVSGDIQDFYYNVQIPEADRDCFRFLWFRGGDFTGQIDHFRFKVHIFGGVASQTAAILALRHAIQDSNVAAEEADRYLSSFYSDDFLTSYASEEEAMRSTEKLVSILRSRGFNLTKWRSNSRAVSQRLNSMNCVPGSSPSAENQEKLVFEQSDSSALGLVWNTERDTLVYKFDCSTVPTTKREALSMLMRVSYDPPGLVAPYKVPLKVAVRDIVCSSSGWDSRLTEQQNSQLAACMDSLRVIQTVEIPRCIASGASLDTLRDLHVFCDGSTVAYGACAYVVTRTERPSGQVQCALVRSKDKLAPIRRVLTVPKLELSACQLAVKLAGEIVKESSLRYDSIFYWTDSMCTLATIANMDRRFPVFVAHKLAEIQTCSDLQQWRYVPTDLNVADVLSRGKLCKTASDVSQTWLNGPDFLSDATRASWPAQPEVKVCDAIVEMIVPVYDGVVWYRKVNSWFRLKYHAAVWMRIRRVLQWRVQTRKGTAAAEDKPPVTGPVTVSELREAESGILIWYQRDTFVEDLHCLRTEGAVPSTSTLLKLRPVLHEGLLCVGGRIKHANLPTALRHPVLLPRTGHVTELIVDHVHRMSVHGSVNQVLTDMRLKYWVVGVKPAVKRIVNRCLACKRFRVKKGEQLMADLPKERVAVNEIPFTHSGVDLFGPVLVRRGRSELKRWVAIYTCLTTRAVHVEVVNSMDQQDFLESFHRFRVRRGTPATLRSDQAGNFTASDAEIQLAIAQWNESLGHEMLQMGVEWSYSPPYGPHHNGAIERMVGLVKRVLKHTFAGRVMSEESFVTLVTEAEGVVNSRPLTAFSDNPEDFRPLTPYDILLLKPQKAIPIGLFTKEDNFAMKSYRTAQYNANTFWARFVKEYVTLLQERRKWTKERRDFKIGDLVLLVDESVPRGFWRMGRVNEVKHGSDGHVRSLMIKTPTGTYQRSICKACLLEAVGD